MQAVVETSQMWLEGEVTFDVIHHLRQWLGEIEVADGNNGLIEVAASRR